MSPAATRRNQKAHHGGQGCQRENSAALCDQRVHHPRGKLRELRPQAETDVNGKGAYPMCVREELDQGTIGPLVCGDYLAHCTWGESMQR